MSDVTSQAGQPIPAGPPLERVEGGRWGWVLAGVWLVYLLDPLRTAWQADSAWERILGVGALLAFSATFLVAASFARTVRRGHGHIPMWRRWALLAVLLVLGALALPAIGELALGTLVYIVAMAMMLLPTVPAIVVSGILLVGAETAIRTVDGWHHDNSVGLAIILAGLAAFGIQRALQRGIALDAARADIATLAVEQERTRFARDLHDILGHSLTVITVKAELARRVVAADPDRTTSELSDIEGLARSALADVRSAVAGYREISLAGELVAAATALRAAGIEAELPTAVDQVPEEHRELFAWVIREGVTNVVRHARASRCTIRLGPSEVEVVDDGRGAAISDDAPAGSSNHVGHGLTGLRERAATAGAMMRVEVPPGGGYRLAVRVDGTPP